jgi:hypothetical protein
MRCTYPSYETYLSVRFDVSMEEKIANYCLSIVNSINLLHDKNLYGQILIIIYSSIDTMGLLDAPPNQTSASGESFKNWVKNYILSYPNIEFNEEDLWGACCAVLHTFTSESDLSKSNKVREIQYIEGNKEGKESILQQIRTLDNGKHVPAFIEDLIFALFEAIKKFTLVLLANCQKGSAYEKRLNKVFQTYAIKTQ